MLDIYKYEGNGNDFIMLNNLNNNISLNNVDIKRLCDRHFGVGSDGLILIEKSDKADCFMNYYNSDGTLAEMCGNGIRCAAKFFLEQTDFSLNELSIDTRTGIKKITHNSDDTFSVNMGMPIFEHDDFPNGVLSLEGLEMECVSMGNPHAVVMVDSLNDFNVKTIGPEIENDYHFPRKINVEFVEKIDDTNYKVKVWERGCGETLACGTGACAIFAILSLPLRQGLVSKEITLEFPGGKLYVSKDHEGNIILRGPATFVFKGEIN